MVTEQIQWNFGMAKDILRPSNGKYRQKKQEIKPRLFDISRFTVFERNSGEGRRSEVSLKEMNVNIYIYLLGY